MNTPQPPILASRLLGWMAPGPHADAVAGDLIEQYRQGRSAAWYWRQVLWTIVVCVAKDRTLGGPALLGSLLVLVLLIASVYRHPASLGSDPGLFIADTALLSGYAAFSVWAWRQRRPKVRLALAAGTQAGILLSMVLIASHTIEWVPLFESRTAQLIRGAGSVLLMLGLPGAAGSAAWQRTRSIRLAGAAGLWCGALGILSLLGYALSLNLTFAGHAASRLHDPFMASGMSDAGAFVVRNSLEAASEILVRLTIAAFVLSVLGSLSNAWIAKWPRAVAVLAACFAPLAFLAGAASLWYANDLERAARPPFVMAGVLTAGIVLCAAHPIWSCLYRTYPKPSRDTCQLR